MQTVLGFECVLLVIALRLVKFSRVPHFWFMAGNLALCRFNSKLVALQIVAQLKGLFTDIDRCEL